MGITNSTAVEIVLNAQHNGFIVGDSLDLVTPLSGNLDTSLDGFSTGVHGQNHVIAKVLSDELCKFGEDIIVECSRAESQSARLLRQGLDELRMTMPLVDSRVGREEVEVVAAFRIPHRHSRGTGKDHGQWVVVVGSEVMLCGDGRLGGRGVVGGRHGYGAGS